MPFARASSRIRTLRFRLTLWNTAVLLLLLLAALTAVRVGLRLALYRMVDEFLDEELFAACLDAGRLADRAQLYDQLGRRAAGHPRRRLFIRVFDPAGNLLWSSIHSPDHLELSATALAANSLPVSANGDRLVQGPAQDPSGARLLIRVGCTVGRARAELARLTEILVVVGAALLFLSPLGGYLLAGRATRPLARIIGTTARLQPAHLDERLPLRATGDELDQLSQTINGFLDRIARYLQQTRDFTANAAHELRSPLTALHTSLEVALSADRSPAEYQDLLAELLEECGRLRTLVTQLLLLAEGDAGRLCGPPEPVRLDQVVRKSAEMFHVAAEAAGVELGADHLEPLTVPGDATRLWQVVNNLIDNAVKFTPPGGRIFLDLCKDPSSGAAVLRVKDTGAGIDPADLPHVFDRFYRGDKSRHRKERTQGTGLGLSICQAVVAAHGGTVAVASTPGSGTEVTVRLPGCSRAP